MGTPGKWGPPPIREPFYGPGIPEAAGGRIGGFSTDEFLEIAVTVLHVIPSVSPLRGGPSMVIRTMVGGQVERGAKVDVATTDDDGAGRFESGSSRIESGGTYRFFPR